MEALRINGPNQKPSALVYLRISNHLKISPKQHQKHIMNNKMNFFHPLPELLPVLGPWEQLPPTLDVALLCSSRAVSDLGLESGLV